MPVNPPTVFKKRSAVSIFISSVVLFLLYLPAMRAGFVGDYFKDWLQVIQTESFWNYLNRSGTATLYQFTQLITYLIYQIIGASRTGWHFVHITMHAVNCALLFAFVKKLLNDSKINQGKSIAVCITLLFIVSPYNSEVIVHEPCLHYTFGFCMMVLPLLWLLKFLENGRKKYLIWIVLLYIPASFSLEVFYLTPWIILLFAIYYCFHLNRDLQKFRIIVVRAFLPMMIIFLVHILLVRSITHTTLPHQVSSSASDLLAHYNSKVLKYVFHILCGGRFFSQELKTGVYRIAESSQAIAVFHAFIAMLIFFLFLKKTGIRIKLIGILTLICLLLIAVVTPREFPEMQRVVLDRYMYFAMPFTYLVFAIFITTPRFQYIALVIFIAFTALNIFWLRQINVGWHKSNQLVEELLESFPVANEKITLLLNTPENYGGILMIGSNKPSALKTAYNTKHEQKITGKVEDIASFNMTDMKDGAHVKVINDSVVQVTLNQWGTWWWFHYIGATSYQNDLYGLDIKDVGRWYELVLRKPANLYQLLFVNEGSWKVVDMKKTGDEQY